MKVTPQIEEFILMRAEVNANCTYENPTEQNFLDEELKLRLDFSTATEGDYCTDCFGIGDCHYLGCPVWDIYRALTGKG